MSQYVDGFILPLPLDRLDDYRQLAELAATVWREHGALEYREWIGDDMEIAGHVTFPSVVAARPGETVLLSWITYESREHRDSVNAKVMADPRIAPLMAANAMPFDSKRMAYGGFKNLVTA